MTQNSFYIGDVDSDLDGKTEDLIGAIGEQAQKAHGIITLYINSFGGYAHVAFGWVEHMEWAKAHDITVRTVVTHCAYSAGSVLAVAGTPGERYIARNGQHMLHYGSVGSGRLVSPDHAYRNHEYTQRHFGMVVDHYEKYCAIPDLQEQLRDNDWFVPAAKAKKYKMADHYTDKLPL